MNTITLTATHLQLAREKFEGDLDTFEDWLGGECFGRSGVSGERYLRLTHTLAEAPVAELLQIAVFGVAHATAEERIAALDELRGRYLAEKAEYRQRLENEMAEEYPA